MVLIFLLVLFIMYLLIFVLCLTLSVLEKLKNLNFEIPIIPQTLNIYKVPDPQVHSLSVLISGLPNFLRAMSMQVSAQKNKNFVV